MERVVRKGGGVIRLVVKVIEKYSYSNGEGIVIRMETLLFWGRRGGKTRQLTGKKCKEKEKIYKDSLGTTLIERKPKGVMAKGGRSSRG